MRRDDKPRFAAEPGRIGVVNAALTALFVAATALGFVVRDARPAAAVVAMVLFTVGIVAFIWSFVTAAELSRTKELGVAGLYMLTGSVASNAVKRWMLGLLALQVITAFAGAIGGFVGLADDDLNPMAFGILAPMLGFGTNGLWASRNGRFGPRIVDTTPARRRPPAPDQDTEPTDA